jgi:Arc/MetJ family transcription regulator
MQKATIEVDEELFAQVCQALGTQGLDATVTRAFELVLSIHARRAAARQLVTLDGLDLDSAEITATAWQ